MRNQTVHCHIEIEGTKIGGMGTPTLLIGNVYSSQLIKGDKKYEETASIISELEKLAKTLKINHFYDIIIERKQHVMESLESIIEASGRPFLVDSGSQKILQYAIREAAKRGVINRLILNSINTALSQDLLKDINHFGVKGAVLQAFNLKDNTVKGRMKSLEDILKMLSDSTIERKIIDCALTDIESIRDIILTFQEIKRIKKLPVGAAPCNATYILKKRSKAFLCRNFKSYDTALNVILRSYGADFLIYGHIKAHGRIFKAISTYDSISQQLIG